MRMYYFNTETIDLVLTDYKAHKIWWEDGKADDRCKIDTNGCPYIILGYDVREYQHGPDRNIKKKIQYKAEKFAGLCQPVGPEVKAKIRQLVGDGGCDSDDHQKDLILEEMKKEFDSPCCDMEDKLDQQYRAVKENDKKLLDVFLPEVMVSFVMMVEGLNRFQSELFLRTDIHKLIQYSSE
ncbi:unnamed protein product [Mytilus coruscus]|uniref:Uncharacterized protein n=1 Tax=Mytilus coruscus TaxID=42192 RepID=A0A6J8CDZ5_MYTCO|nr:unnamed protein product [Mytilus coruscus]